MLLWIWTLGIYSGLSSIALVIIQKRRLEDWTLLEDLRRITTDLSPAERLQATQTILKIREEHSLWFERSLSTIGIVAFFSMLIATGVQTYRSAVDSAQAEQLRKEVATLEHQRAEVDGLVSGMSHSLIAEYRESGRLDRPARRILGYRAAQLRDAPQLSADDLVELFDISLLLRDFEAAKSAIDRNRRLLDETKPEHQLSLAEYDYLVGANHSAADIADRLEVQRSELHLPKQWQIRVIVLSAVLHGDIEKYAAELSAVEKIGLAESQKVLITEMDRLRDRPIPTGETAESDHQ